MPKTVEVVEIRKGNRTVYGLCGNTYDFKEQIKSFRGTWSPINKMWELPLDRTKCETMAQNFNGELANKELISHMKKRDSAIKSAKKRQKYNTTLQCATSDSNKEKYNRALELHAEKEWIPFFTVSTFNGICHKCRKNIFDYIDPEKLQHEIGSCPACHVAWDN